MSYELVYTSAARGLRPGSQGFCVVVSTQGLSANLADRLESLSGYRHVFPPQDAQAALNPIVWSHLRLSAGGRNCHVLSRIAASGLDYTQRSNKIAHHVALDAAELIPAGPAALLRAPGFMDVEWQGEPRMLAAGRRVPAVTSSPAICRAWQAATGDAGWGGVVAESAAGSTVRPVLLIYPPGTDVLSLLAESLALLPPERRWDVTFSSYYTRLPAGVDCQWRGLVAGSPEALAARHVPGALVIDLTRPPGAAHGGSLVTVARTGHSAAVRAGQSADPRPQPLPERAQPVVEEAAYALDIEPPAAPPVVPRARAPLADMGIELGPPPQAAEEFWQPAMHRTERPKPPSHWPLILTASVGALLCVGLGLFGWTRLRERQAVARQQATAKQQAAAQQHTANQHTGTQHTGTQHAAPPNQPSPRVTTPPNKPQERPRPTKPVNPPKAPAEPDDEPVDDEPMDPADVPSREGPTLVGPAPEESPAPDVAVSIPPRPAPEVKPPVRWEATPASVELPAVGVQVPAVLFALPSAGVDYVIKLRGPRMVDGAQWSLKQYEPGNYWILAEFASAAGGSEKIAHLQRHDGNLEFRWEQLKNTEQRLRWRELKNQVLLVRAGDAGERIVALRKPVRAQPLALAFGGQPAESRWEVEGPPAGNYTAQFQISGNPAAAILALASREHSLSVSLRAEPVATPVKLSVEVTPPKVFGKHMLQGKVDGTVHLVYRGVPIAREHLKADDPQALEPTAEPEPVTPEDLRVFIAALGAKLRDDGEKLKALPPPPPPGAPPPPPGDEKAQQRRQLDQTIRWGNQRLRTAQALGRLLATLQTARFDYQLFCDVDGHPVCVVSTSDSPAPQMTSTHGH